MRPKPPFLLHHLVLNAAERLPEALACIAKDGRVTFSELATSVTRFASALTTLQCLRFERVAVYLPKLVATATAIFGSSRAGCIAVPINPVLKAPQVKHILLDSGASVLVTSLSRLQLLMPVLPEIRSLRHIILVDGQVQSQSLPTHEWNAVVGDGEPVAARDAVETDTTAILYTSGSTGMPKGVVLSHRNMVVGACSVVDYLENTEDDRILSILPLSFDAGLSQLTTAFHAGARVVLLDYLLPKDVVRICAQEKITGITGVPPLWMQLAALEWPDSSSRYLRYFANTGGKMPKATLNLLRAQFPSAKPYLMYGLTEAFRSTYLPPSEVDSRPDSIGKAIPNAEILVMRDDGIEAGPHEPGELVHRGPLVAQGYWNDSERSKERFRPISLGPVEVPVEEIAVWSGDTVVKDEEGFLYFIGRKDDMIKTSGYRVSPTELEELVHATGLVAEAAAVGVEHAELGQAIVMFVVPRGERARDDDLLEPLKEHLPGYMIPRKIFWYEELPRNPNGKINRTLLREQATNTFQRDHLS